MDRKKKRLKVVIECNIVAAVCFGIACYGNLVRGNIAFGVLLAALALAQLVLAFVNYNISKKQNGD